MSVLLIGAMIATAYLVTSKIITTWPNWFARVLGSVAGFVAAYMVCIWIIVYLFPRVGGAEMADLVGENIAHGLYVDWGGTGLLFAGAAVVVANLRGLRGRKVPA